MWKIIKKRWQALSAWQIILLCMLIGLVVGLIVGWQTGSPVQRQTPPFALPALPAEVVAIESISTLGFFDPNIRIKAADEETYTFLEWQDEGQQWSTEIFYEPRNDGKPCSAEIVNLLQSSAGALVECQTAQIYGEWCPGPIVSIAITETGEVWEIDEYLFCGFVFQMSLFLVEAISLLVGLFIASFKLIAKWFPYEGD